MFEETGLPYGPHLVSGERNEQTSLAEAEHQDSLSSPNHLPKSPK